MLGRWRTRVFACAIFILSSCTDGGGASTTARLPSEPWRGGTLRVAAASLSTEMLDPKVYFGTMGWTIHRCLLRTLLSYAGRPAAEGGSTVRPDLATDLPQVSADGLTWTFRLKDGLHYAPPFEGTDIVTADIVRALERRGEPWDSSPAWGGGYRFYYSVIEGFDEYWAGRTPHISGLETPDEHTLVVRLREPVGHLSNLFAMPATAPVPAGAADGHARDYGRFLVASGPYMIEGSEDLDFSLPPRQQRPVSGFVPGKWDPKQWSVQGAGALTLVRNPSWDSASDALRPAYADRIEFTLLDWESFDDPESLDRLVTQVESGEIDVDYVTGDARWLRRHPPERVLRFAVNGFAAIYVNLAVPPFDDPHVRKAVALAIDRAALVHEAEGAEGLVEQIGHVAPDGVEGGLLTGWQPDWLQGTSDDLRAAQAEMRSSPYDYDGDGRCDDPACRGVRALARESAAYSWTSVRAALAKIGVHFDATVAGSGVFFARGLDPGERWGLWSGEWGWNADFPNGSTVFVPLFSGAEIREGGNNWSNVGASPMQLEDWGYAVTEVPSVDERIDRCMALVFGVQEECWADLDRYLMGEVVPLVPLYVFVTAASISARVTKFSFDQFTGTPAFDRVALAEGSA